MTGGRRDVESDLRQLVARDALAAVRALRRRERPSMDASLDYLIGRAYKSPDILLDARDLLGEQDTEGEHCCTARHGWPATPSDRSRKRPEKQCFPRGIAPVVGVPVLGRVATQAPELPPPLWRKSPVARWGSSHVAG